MDRQYIKSNQIRLEYDGVTTEGLVDDNDVASIVGQGNMDYAVYLLKSRGYSVMDTKAMKLEEVLYSYRNSQQISSQTGLIGYTRADMGSSGQEFWTTWNGFREDLNTPEFREDYDNVIQSFREKGEFLSSRPELAKYCLSNKALPFDTGRDYGVRVDTHDYAFLMRLNPHKGDYNLYCYCYKKDWLDHHIEKAKRGIRFIDPNYKEQFRLYDGDEIVLTGKPDGFTVRDIPARYVCRYIDDYHFEYGPNLRHICEFAEMLENLGYTVTPLRASLPEKAYVYVDTEYKVGYVKKGESGYYPLDLSFRDQSDARDYVDTNNQKLGISKAQAAAMKFGSMFGWTSPAADPKNYDNDGHLLKSQHKSRDTAR